MSKGSSLHARVLKPESYLIENEPYYEPVGDEIALFEAAYASRLPVLLKVPTGCGKPRFMEHMAWRLQRPLITVSCHDDLTAADLVGRYLITNNEITIDRETRDYLPHLYGPVNWTLVDDVARLLLKVADIYRRLTA